MRHTLADRVFAGADLLDSRDLIARLKELADERESALTCDIEGHDKRLDGVCPECWTEDQEHELSALTAVADEASGSPDWLYGETLIHDAYFETYARELAEDIGAVNKNALWPQTCIDWAEAAERLQQDYFSVEYDSETYWIRS